MYLATILEVVYPLRLWLLQQSYPHILSYNASDNIDSYFNSMKDANE